MSAPYVSVISSARWRFVLMLCTRSLSGDRESYKKTCNEVERHVLVGHAQILRKKDSKLGGRFWGLLIVASIGLANRLT